MIFILFFKLLELNHKIPSGNVNKCLNYYCQNQVHQEKSAEHDQPYRVYASKDTKIHIHQIVHIGAPRLSCN